MIECSLVQRSWRDSVVYGACNFLLCILPYAFWLLGVNLRFAIPLVLVEMVINFYHWLVRPADEAARLAKQLIEEAKQRGQQERVALVTGGTSGIGREVALALAMAGYRLILPARQKEKAREVVEELRRLSGNDKIEMIEADLMELGSVLQLGQSLSTLGLDRLHLLVNNAGVYEGVFKGNSEGLEAQWMTNYFAPFLLTRLCIPLLRKAAELDKDARIINVSSAAAYCLPSLDWHSAFDPTHFSFLGNYCQTKYALLLFTSQLARRLAGLGITVTAMEPGMVRTQITRSSSLATAFAHGLLANVTPMLFPSALQGALTILWLAMAKETRDLPGGTLYAHLRQAPLGLALQRDLAGGEATRLWSRSEMIVRMSYDPVLK